ncbi:Tyrosinase [Dactylellina cionopaga]|nr:Tyrosinase [Dactylellina cionopaga]
MIEQTIYNIAKDIANKFTGSNKTKYVAAAKLIRWPYWDWADSAIKGHLPPVVTTTTIQVTAPEGQKTINNPFYTYKFKGTEASNIPGYYNGASKVVRGPQADLSVQALFAPPLGDGLPALVYKGVLVQGTYTSASYDIEQIHNHIHNAIKGFMTDPQSAAFDPLFWLHHCNVDRLIAIWQAANPALGLVNNASAATSSYQQFKPGSGITLNTPLLPFKHADGSWWTSQDVFDVRSIWDYGYGYPEVPCARKSNTDAQLDDFSTAQTSLLYNRKGVLAKRDEAQNITQWDYNVVVDQAEFNGTFQVVVFAQDPGNDTTTWDLSPYRLGALTILGNPGQVRPSNVVTAIIGATKFLEVKGVLGKSDSYIDKFLQKKVIWKCVNDDKLVDIKTIKTLKIGVTKNSLLIPADNRKKAKLGTPKLRLDATEGTVGGVTKVEDLTKPKRKDGERKKASDGLAKLAVAPSNSTATTTTGQRLVRKWQYPAPVQV